MPYSNHRFPVALAAADLRSLSDEQAAELGVPFSAQAAEEFSSYALRHQRVFNRYDEIIDNYLDGAPLQ